ncbi:hypothetical protein CRV08_01065 [Halarcobacter ebronensis]|uniref:Acyloxyacyl hydrolase n=1 Tax=Halarcobacter ebronensis TaxID=1462615 RepID=A0A4Q0YHQ0_9BACT|nr:acyloxyacyl hydrolase [Halarcobacter ebronensis]RXJ70186.1 hypothetical protein CRV08_01065 [Halarcobacter ebronensis]
MKRFLLFLVFFSLNLSAFDRVNFEYATWSKDIDIFGIGLQKDLDYKIIENTKLSVEVDAEYVDGENDDMYILSAQPMISYDLTSKLYLEGGIGISYFSEKSLDNKKFGMHFQFKENIGFGYRITDNFETTLKYTHYSNADLDDENSGIDSVGLKFIYLY